MYKLILLAHDGEFVTEKPQNTVHECSEQSADMGSRWFFYPFHFIIKDKGRVSSRQRIIETPYELRFLKGVSVKTAREWVAANQFYFPL